MRDHPFIVIVKNQMYSTVVDTLTLMLSHRELAENIHKATLILYLEPLGSLA